MVWWNNNNNNNRQGCPTTPIKPRRRGNEIAIVACGCYCHAQLVFRQLPGVYQVTAGYTGGWYQSPSLCNTGDHSEAVLIEYNPNVVSYFNLLWTWKAVVDNGASPDWEISLRPLRHALAIFPTSQFQMGQAQRFVRFQTQKGSACTFHNVRIGQPSRFYLAEESQQDFVSKSWKAVNKLKGCVDSFAQRRILSKEDENKSRISFHPGGNSRHQRLATANQVPTLHHDYNRQPPARCVEMFPTLFSSIDAVAPLKSSDAVCEESKAG